MGVFSSILLRKRFPSGFDVHQQLIDYRISTSLTAILDRQQHLHVDMDMDLKPALAYLEAASSDCFDQTLNRLKTIRIRRVARSRPVLLLIKLLLDLSPNLEMISIEPGVTTADDDDDENDKFLEDVMRFPRASSKAELRLMVH
ncbi:uncharacterized protein [Rutidosis leptorrhynchoides]|uniref:uncharacterized protein n=1 Tax=Rutidosis leptorrhynchoides TaxID=125765 RepID=UPI003A991C66